MKGSMLALLALVVATFVSYNHQRAAAETNERMLSDEYEVMASGVALQVMEFVGAHAFDAATVSAEVDAASALAQIADFGTSPACDVEAPLTTTCTAIDDFHMASDTWQTIAFETRTGTFTFEVQTEVAYVKDDLKTETTTSDPDDGRTFHKKVTVYVRSEDTIQGKRILPMIYVQRVFSYTSES